MKEAVQEDQAGNYQKAFDLYKIALEYFSTHLKYEKNPRSKAAISEKARWLPASAFTDRADQACHQAEHMRTVR